MRVWNLLRNASGLKCRYTYGPDKRYQLRRERYRSGQGVRWVWALYFGEQRIHEVHALMRAGIVMADAEDYIREARMAG